MHKISIAFLADKKVFKGHLRQTILLRIIDFHLHILVFRI